ncbi:putative membrane protein YdjX (TVP38/TMEM64 family) [Paenibacillus sp. DS2015]|uniref:TVP38/TMEM64 family protein n=1 Tax=Paenibacillus sp. DS2015 TaxID=3373917 RepID=UPI003D1E21D5
MKKWLLLLLYVLLLGIAFINKTVIWDWMNRNDSLTLLITMATLFALFPIVPYKLVIATLGYTSGIVWASIISWLGTMLAGVIVYGLVRYAFREQGRRYLAKKPWIQSFTTTIETHPFIAIMIARLLPIVPQMAVNIFAGVASISLWRYTLASGIGKLPGIVLYAYLGENLASSPYTSLSVLAIYLLLLGIVLSLYKMILKRRSI